MESAFFFGSIALSVAKLATKVELVERRIAQAFGAFRGRGPRRYLQEYGASVVDYYKHGGILPYVLRELIGNGLVLPG